jgi:hypothetical protein
VKNAKARHVRKTEMDSTTPDTFRTLTMKFVTEGPNYKAITMRTIAEEQNR